MKIDRIKKSFAAHGIVCTEIMGEHEFLPGLHPFICCEIYSGSANVLRRFRFPKDCYTYSSVYRFLKNEGYLHSSRLVR